MKHRDTVIYKYRKSFEDYTHNTATVRTYRLYCACLARFFALFWFRAEPDHVTSFDVKDYIIRRQRQGRANSTINYELSVLRCFWNWLMEHDVASANPFASVILDTVPTNHTPVTEDTYRAILESCELPVERLLITLMAATPLNGTELSALDWSDIDLQSSTILVRDKYIPLRPQEVTFLREFKSFGRVFAEYANNQRMLLAKFRRITQRAGFIGVTQKALKDGYVRMLFRAGETVTV